MTIHSTAVVHASARLGAGTTVGPYAVIEEDVILGDGCSIGAHAVIKRYTKLGRENRVFEHAVIGAEPQDFKFRECASSVELGDANVIREGVTIHRAGGEGRTTRIGSHNFLMAYCHVAHDCLLGDRVVMANGALLGGHVTIGDGAFISGVATIHQFCRVGRLAMVSQGARVTQDCLPFTITEGHPARARSLNTIGLRRAGLSAEAIASLRQALKLLLRPAVPLAQALEAIDRIATPEVSELAGFIRSSPRGFAHGSTPLTGDLGIQN